MSHWEHQEGPAEWAYLRDQGLEQMETVRGSPLA